MRQFDDRPRHVVIRCHHDQRLEAALAHPAPGLRRVAAGIDRGAVEIDAAAQQRLVVGQRTRNIAGGVGRVHAGNQQPLAEACGQQFHRVRDPRGAAGQHHDAVGVAFGLHFGAAQLREKAYEPGRRCHEGDRQRGDDRGAQPPFRRGHRRVRRSIVGLPAHAMPRFPSRPKSGRLKSEPKSRTFSHEVESGLVQLPSRRQSMSSSVASSVRRDAQAVIAAISTACAASAR